MSEELKKREWIYVYPPAHYQIACDRCQGYNLAWSEFEHKVWCYDCQLDVSGNGGMFTGPIPWNATKILLGEYCFHRMNIKTGEILEPYRPQGEPGPIEYRTVKSLKIVDGKMVNISQKEAI